MLDVTNKAKTKYCRHCESYLPDDLEHFYVSKGNTCPPCKECRKQIARKNHFSNHERNLARNRAYQKENSLELSRKARERNATEEVRAAQKIRNRAYYAANRDKLVADERDRRVKNKAAIRERDRVRNSSDARREQKRNKSAEHKAEIAARARLARAADPERFAEYDRRRYAQTKFRMTRSINAAIRRHLKLNGSCKDKAKRTIAGWSIQELCDHLVPLFEDGMCLNNWGSWQIDHVIPLSQVAVSSEDDPNFRAVWSLENLAPLWAADNNAKHKRLDWRLPDSYKNPNLRQMYATPKCAFLIGRLVSC